MSSRLGRPTDDAGARKLQQNPNLKKRYNKLGRIGRGSFGNVFRGCGGATWGREDAPGGRRAKARACSTNAAGGANHGRRIDQESGQEVAIKTVDLEDARDGLDDLQQEIALMASFDSPYVTRYFGSFVVDRELWIVMEYMAGGSVYDLVRVPPRVRRTLRGSP